MDKCRLKCDAEATIGDKIPETAVDGAYHVQPAFVGGNGKMIRKPRLLQYNNDTGRWNVLLEGHLVAEEIIRQEIDIMEAYPSGTDAGPKVSNGFRSQTSMNTFKLVNPDLDALKSLLVERGVIVHADIELLNDHYKFEDFVNGIGTFVARHPAEQGAVKDGDSIAAIADSIAAKYKHFAFHKACDFSYTELRTGRRLGVYSLVFAAW